jgi:hypothetical protein
MLILSGSADNTLRYWSMNLSEINNNLSRAIIHTEYELTWPIKIEIEKYKKSNNNGEDLTYLIICLCANGLIYLNIVYKVDEFVANETKAANSMQPQAELENFKFKYNLKISPTFKCSLNAQLVNNQIDSFDQEFFNRDDNLLNFALISNKSHIRFSNERLTAFLVTDNNSNQNVKLFVKEWKLFLNIEEETLDSIEEFVDNDFYFEHLNRRFLSIEDVEKAQFEIITFGFR